MDSSHQDVQKLCAQLAQGEITEELESMIKTAVDTLLAKSSKLSDEYVRQVLTIVIAMVKSGREELIKKSKDTLLELKKSKSLDWKKHLAEAKQILNIVGELPTENMQDDKKRRLKDTVGDYCDFVEMYLDMLKKGKVLLQLQSSLVIFFFNCIQISTPAKSNFAETCSSRKHYMDFSKEPSLRQEVLEKFERLLLNNDLPKGNRGINWGLGNILDRVVDSYNNNGKTVTAKENQLFMSIFKLASEGAETIAEQFYDEDDEDIPNINMRIWRDGLTSYARMV